jgi:hypothetical protein
MTQAKYFLHSKLFRLHLESTQPHLQGYWNHILGGEGGRGVKAITYIEIVPLLNNMWSFASTPPYAFKCRDNFNFAFKDQI